MSATKHLPKRMSLYDRLNTPLTLTSLVVGIGLLVLHSVLGAALLRVIPASDTIGAVLFGIGAVGVVAACLFHMKRRTRFVAAARWFLAAITLLLVGGTALFAVQDPDAWLPAIAFLSAALCGWRGYRLSQHVQPTEAGV